MPVSIEYSWHETFEKVVVTVKRPPVKRSSIDVFTTDVYLKVSAPPYLLAIDLKYEILEEDSSATLGDDNIVFELCKKEKGVTWGELKAKGDASTIKGRRDHSISKSLELAQELKEKMMKEKRDVEKKAFEEQWELEKKRRQIVEDRKAKEKEEAEKKLYAFEYEYGKGEGEGETEMDDPRVLLPTKKVVEESGRKEDEVLDLMKKGEQQFRAGGHHFDADERKRNGESKRGSEMEMEREEKAVKKEVEDYVVPPVRSGAKITYDFTPSDTTLPARGDHEENLMAERMRMDDLFEKRKDIEGVNAQWMKDRGDYFYKLENYDSALAAYEEAMKMQSNFLLAQMNASTCLMRLARYEECIALCSSIYALLMTISDARRRRPDVAKKIVKILVRRGTCHCMLDHGDEAIADYEEACRIDSENVVLHLDLEDLRRAFGRQDQSSKSQSSGMAMKINPEAIEWKAKGDLCYRNQDFLEAANAYSQAISVDKNLLSAYSNRSACFLHLSNWEDCISETSFVIDCLNELIAAQGISSLSVMLLRNLCRRGVAYVMKGRIEEALDDYERAVKVDPSNSDLRADYEKLSEWGKARTGARWLKNQAMHFMKDENFASAKISLDKAIEQDHGDSLHGMRAVCHFHTGEFELCIRDALVVKDGDAYDDGVQFAHAKSLCSIGEMSDGKALLNNLIETSQDEDMKLRAREYLDSIK